MAQAPEQRRASKREYYLRNREKIREQQRDWYERNRAAMLEQQAQYRARNSGKDRDQRIRRKHGLWPEEWAATWEAQDGLCYLCGEPMIPYGHTGAHVDHDHSHCPPNTSCRICQRGLACMDCNIAIGHARNSPARLRRMADALEAAQLLVDQRKAEAGERLTLF